MHVWKGKCFEHNIENDNFLTKLICKTKESFDKDG